MGLNEPPNTPIVSGGVDVVLEVLMVGNVLLLLLLLLLVKDAMHVGGGISFF